jgi:hypothetical protein
LIITGQLSSIDDCVSCNIWAETCPQSGDAFLPSDLGISIHGPSVAALHARRKLPLSLKPDLDKVSGVGDVDGNGTCSQLFSSSLRASGERMEHLFGKKSGEWMEQRSMGKGGGEQQDTGCEACGDLLGQGNIPNMIFANVERFDLLQGEADGKVLDRMQQQLIWAKKRKKK